MSLVSALFLAILAFASCGKYPSDISSPKVIRERLNVLTAGGKMADVVTYLERVEKYYGSLVIDNEPPSLYDFLGVGYYNTLRQDEAEAAFKKGVALFPNNSRTWINLGEIQVQLFKLNDAVHSFSKSLVVGDTSALPRLLRTKGWSASWKDFEVVASNIELLARRCLEDLRYCELDSTGGVEYTDASGPEVRLLTSLTPNSRTNANLVKSSGFWKSRSPSNGKRLKLGFISSDFGIHPVASLVRGMMQFLDVQESTHIEVFCFALHPKMSWWGHNITDTVEHFVELQGMNTYDAAVKIAELQVEVLIDLNGHTMNSGLQIMSHRPAPLQISYLGLPTTTAASFIDYYIGDVVSLPAEQHNHFTEKLILMSNCYIANDFAQVQGDVLLFNNRQKTRAARSLFLSRTPVREVTEENPGAYLLASLSNSQKMSPDIFQVWMQIMSKFSGATMLFNDYAGHETYMPHLRTYGAYFGVHPGRLVSADQTPWIDHLYVKTSLDLVLDTITKNGHTTGLDGIWAGVPTVSFAGGASMPARSAEAIAKTLGNDYGLTYSLKEYEDLVFSLLKTKQSLRNLLKRRSAPGGEEKFNATFLDLDGGRASANANEDQHRRNKMAAAKKLIRERRAAPAGLTTTITQHRHHHHQQQQRTDDQPSPLINVTSTNEGPNHFYHRLNIWRADVEKRRKLSKLYDTPTYVRSFSRLLQAMWESAHIAQERHNVPEKDPDFRKTLDNNKNSRFYHIFESQATSLVSNDRGSKELHREQQGIATAQVYSGDTLIFRAKEAYVAKFGAVANEVVSQVIPKSEKRLSGAPKPGLKQKKSDDEWKKGERAEQRKAPPTIKKEVGSTDQQQEDDSILMKTRKTKQDFPPLPLYVFDGRHIMLNIGGITARDGWLNVNSQAENYNMTAAEVDIIREMHDLHGFANNSVSAIYSSHTLEHNDIDTMMKTLREWSRVLRPGGLLMVSVPDLETLARMYLDKSFTLDERWKVTKMIYGAQFDDYDFHKVGFNEDLLSYFLRDAGFCNLERLQSFNLGFSDTSELRFKDYFISLNIAARPCKPALDGFSINHSGTVYHHY